VRDFIRIEAQIGSYSVWPWIFNIADALLVVGVIILLLNFWVDHRKHNAASAAESARGHADGASVAPAIASPTESNDNSPA
jgi:hypothetical protein